jgi:hypothetical protein
MRLCLGSEANSKFDEISGIYFVAFLFRCEHRLIGDVR